MALTLLGRISIVCFVFCCFFEGRRKMKNQREKKEEKTVVWKMQ